jgi:catechol 2,3-dioxygenase-like lactoylglutathione lyase family enzyme
MNSISLLAQYCQEIDHIAITVPDLATAIKFFGDTLGFEMLEKSKSENPKIIMDSATFKVGKVIFVLIQKTPLTPEIAQDSEHSRMGIHHLALRVENIEAVIQDLKERGVNFTTDLVEKDQTYQSFSQRDDNSDVMIEFIERKDGDYIFNNKGLFESQRKNKGINDSKDK